MRWDRHEECMGEMINAYKILVDKPDRKRALGRLWSRWENGIRMVWTRCICFWIGTSGGLL
jgi:hypothetical protein